MNHLRICLHKYTPFLIVGILIPRLIIAGAILPPRIEVSSSNYDLGKLKKFEPKEVCFVVKNIGGANLVLNKLRAPNYCVAWLSSSEPIPPGDTRKLKITLIPFGANLRRLSASIAIESNDPKVPVKTLSLKAVVYPPYIHFENYTYNFGEIRQGKKVNCVFGFKSLSKKSLEIKQVDIPRGCIVGTAIPIVIPPEGSGEVRIVLNSENYVGRQNKIVTVFSNDPFEPIAKLRLTGTIKPVSDYPSIREMCPHNITVDSACLHQNGQYDKGTIYIFLKNLGTQTETIEKLFLNGRILTDSPNDGSIWHHTRPGLLKPGRVSNILIKLLKSPEKTMHVRIVSSHACHWNVEVDPFPNSLRFTCIAFSDDLKTVHAYMQSVLVESHAEPYSFYLNIQNVTSKAQVFTMTRDTDIKTYIKVSLEKPLIRGSYISLKVVMEDGQTVQSVVKVLSRFPVSSYGNDTRSRLYFDHTPFLLSANSLSSFAELQTEESERAFLIYDSPNCSIDKNAKKSWVNPSFGLGQSGRAASLILRKLNELQSETNLTSSYINICGMRGHSREEYFIYGDMVDIIGFNSYRLLSKEQPLSEALEFYIAKKASEPRPIISIPEAFTQRGSRYPAPEEERLLVYGSIAEGAKGILYFSKSRYKGNADLETEIGKIDGELQVLKRFLKIAEPYDGISSCNIRKVKTYSLIAGDKGIVLILINGDHESSFDRVGPSFSFKPKVNLVVKVEVPEWMDIKDVYEVGGSWKRLRYKRQRQFITIPVVILNVTKQIVLSTDPKSYNFDYDNDGISDIDEVSSFGSHPSIPAIESIF